MVVAPDSQTTCGATTVAATSSPAPTDADAPTLKFSTPLPTPHIHCPPTPPASAPTSAPASVPLVCLSSLCTTLFPAAADMDAAESARPVPTLRKSTRLMDRQAAQRNAAAAIANSTTTANGAPARPPAKRPARRHRTTTRAMAAKAPSAAAVKSAPRKRPAQLLGAVAADNNDTDSAPMAYNQPDGHYIIVPGSNLTARYKILRLLGQGTFGKVVECWDREMSARVAVKIIRSVPKYRAAADIEIRVLQTIRQQDPHSRHNCIRLFDTFVYRDHMCMVFELLSCSVFDFLKDNNFRPFPLQHVQSFAYQLLQSVAFLHRLKIIHTDLKPENILLVNGDSRPLPPPTVKSASTAKRKKQSGSKVLMQSDIRLIDFGSAAFDDGHHSHVVSTRHYRAPEVLLGLGWSFPCDMWSIGCILLEFLTGDALFQTHDNLEHLALMQRILGALPAHLVRRSVERNPDNAEFFDPVGLAQSYVYDAQYASMATVRVRFPTKNTAIQSVKFVDSTPDLQQLVFTKSVLAQSTAVRRSNNNGNSHNHNQENVLPSGEQQQQQLPASASAGNTFLASFWDLIRRCLHYDPDQRITAAQALLHPVFCTSFPA